MDYVLTQPFRLSYPKLFKAELNNLSGKEEFSCVALFDLGANMADLQKAAKEAVEKKWPDPKKRPKLRSPFRDQGEKEKEDDAGKKFLPQGHTKGAIFLNLKSQQRPGVVGMDKRPVLSEADLYAGCYVVAAVRAYAYEQKGNAGVSFGLLHVMKFKEGEPLGNKVKVEDAFSAIELPPEAAAAGAASAESLFG